MLAFGCKRALDRSVAQPARRTQNLAYRSVAVVTCKRPRNSLAMHALRNGSMVPSSSSSLVARPRSCPAGVRLQRCQQGVPRCLATIRSRAASGDRELVFSGDALLQASSWAEYQRLLAPSGPEMPSAPPAAPVEQATVSHESSAIESESSHASYSYEPSSPAVYVRQYPDPQFMQVRRGAGLGLDSAGCSHNSH